MKQGKPIPRRKNMNLSVKVFKRLERLKRREQDDSGIFTSWDRYFSGVADREERRNEPNIDS